MNKITLARNYLQEEQNEKFSGTRQAFAKRENGESLPDMINCNAIATLFAISLDQLLYHDGEISEFPILSKRKHLIM